ncbi:alpha/beta fold hydrolase [Candidatus Microgenomates bacterium]|nr:alpha/beta fold hydrolase [Candidatus Microgenomates bacterium]
MQPAQSPETAKPPLDPLTIEAMRARDYPGSEVVIEQTLPSAQSYNRYLVSYKSEGLKIYALLTIPIGLKPLSGWPVVIFNHGYIPPEQYQTTQRYEAYVDVFARAGYVVFKPDYRGHGNSDGSPEGAYHSPAYTVDVLNAISSVKKLTDLKNKSGQLIIDSEKIGMWGHSMGGHITLRSMVVSKEIKAGVIWAGVVASYDDLMNRWNRKTPWKPSAREQANYRPSRQNLIEKYGTFEQNPDFWNSISPIHFVSEISGPVQLHHGTIDESVPIEFSQGLKEALEKAGKPVEFYTYEGADHNLSGTAFNLAAQRSLEFFNKHLKQLT